MFGFPEVHLNRPAHRIELQYALRLKTGVRGQEYRPVMLAGLRFFLRGDAANEQQAHLDPLIRLVLRAAQVQFDIQRLRLIRKGDGNC